MTDPRPSQHIAYDANSQKKSKRLMYLLAALGVLIMIVFGGLHLFGQSVGVQI